MKAGLLADLILGESPHLKGLVRHYNILVLNPAGKITGFNQHFIRNSGKSEKQLIHQNFSKIFDSEDGKVELFHSVKQALKGTPGSICFGLTESRIKFKGVILPVYDTENAPESLIIITKEEVSTEPSEQELDNFWEMTTKLMANVGITTQSEQLPEKHKKPKILLIEDKKGLIAKLFTNLMKMSKNNIILAPTSEAALIMASEFRPDVVIASGDSIGKTSYQQVTEQLTSLYKSKMVYVSVIGNEIRIEDGWLDIHVKNQSESVRKILELINQLYW